MKKLFQPLVSFSSSQKPNFSFGIFFFKMEQTILTLSSHSSWGPETLRHCKCFFLPRKKIRELSLIRKMLINVLIGLGILFGRFRYVQYRSLVGDDTGWLGEQFRPNDGRISFGICRMWPWTYFDTEGRLSLCRLHRWVGSHLPQHRGNDL